MTTNPNAHTALSNVLAAALEHVPPHPYLIENDRWLELVVLLLIDAAGLSKERAIAVTSHLSLSHADAGHDPKFSDEIHANFQHAVASPDFDHARVEELATTLERVSHAIEQRFGGGIQRFLRSHGERMVHELSELLAECGVPAQKSRRVATVWLQNVSNMPVLSSDDEHVAAFCKAHQLTPRDLLHLADAMSVNVAYLDDALLAHHQVSSQRAPSGAAVSR